ncbi:MAG: ATP-binding protein [Hyphomicrobiaceae bacterium]|nr:ATP-binding protein [Hyphomicrobiaceae bacterium]
MTISPEILPVLERIASALERAHPVATDHAKIGEASGYSWSPETNSFSAIKQINAVDLDLLQAIETQKSLLLANSTQFAQGFGANNVLLWGTRGMGKSSLIKAVHKKLVVDGFDLKLIEIHREDIKTLPQCLQHLRASPHQIILYCDDLSFEGEDASYKSLKAVLEGGLLGRPENVLFYATSNRRHLMPRDMIENERSTAINPAEAVEEKISLSDRFGLWIGFHNCSQANYLNMIAKYVEHYGLTLARQQLDAEAIEWAATRGARSGRVASQFIQDLAGRQKVKLKSH